MIGFIGDVHGKFGRYDTILKHAQHPTVQIGDMGVGFVRPDGGQYPNAPYNRMAAGGHRFIRGNHDNPGVCRRQSQWIPDGHIETTEKGTKIMYIGGARSIDRDYRTEGVDWWADEEVSYREMGSFLHTYQEDRPDVMITHECPGQVAYKLFLEGTHKPVLQSRTGQFLDGLVEVHRPKLWCHGHWHTSRREVIDGTQFICLNELEHIEIDL